MSRLSLGIEAPRKSSKSVLHELLRAVLEAEVVGAEAGDAVTLPLVDVLRAPAIDLGPGHAPDIPAQAACEMPAWGHPDDVASGEAAPDHAASPTQRQLCRRVLTGSNLRIPGERRVLL